MAGVTRQSQPLRLMIFTYICFLLLPTVRGYRGFHHGIFHSHPSRAHATNHPGHPHSHKQYIARSLCQQLNGTNYLSTSETNSIYTCNVDYPGRDIFPFLHTASLSDCFGQCNQHNQGHSPPCLAAIFVPDRTSGNDNCYLKFSIDNPTASTGFLEGIVVGSSSTAGASTVVSSQTPVATAGKSSSSNSQSHQSQSSATPSSSSYAAGSTVIVPGVKSSALHGPVSNQPTTQYINLMPPTRSVPSAGLLTPGVNHTLSTRYPICLDTGILQLNSTTQPFVADLSDIPTISRDGGKGGYLGGQHLFIFCDTGSYTDGNFLGFISGSVAIDTGMNALKGNPVALQDGIGEWSDNTGRMRGLVPLTDGEQAYNLAMQGDGYRYAAWVESTFIPLSGNQAVIVAPIIYDRVNMQTKAANFTYTGSTLLTLTAGGPGGPFATRDVDLMFYAYEVPWGSIGGIRSWGASGVGGSDGSIYLFGQVPGGLLLGRTEESSVTDRDSYEYWSGSSWSADMPSRTSTAYFLPGNFTDVDVFYSPRHLTFIAVYMTPWADNTFYYRYLEADSAIRPSFAGGPEGDYVENLVKFRWSSAAALYRAPTSLSGSYVYSGGVHLGYFGEDDISNGGTKMMLSWTSPTGQDPGSAVTEYQIMTSEVEWA